MNRRALITTAAMLPVAAVTPAVASEVGPIERCYREYRRRNDWANAADCCAEEVPDSIMDWIDEPINEGLSTRPETAPEFAAYLLLATLDGMQMEGSQQSADMVAMARDVLVIG